MGFLRLTSLPAILVLLVLPSSASAQTDGGGSPRRIVNIINFIRQCEPRIDWITEDVLYETVVEQVKIMKKHGLRGTFLLQFDALIDPRYQKLLKAQPEGMFEIGAWWEIPQPLVENGLQVAGALSVGLACRRGVRDGLLPEGA